MLKTQSNSLPNRRNLTDHPHYFGAFLNIARHNAYMVMGHLSAKYGTKDKDRLIEDSISTAQLFNYLKKKFNKPDITQSLVRDFKRYFPFLNYPLFLNLESQQEQGGSPSYETDPDELRKVLQGMFTLLNSLRNHYSHYLSTVDYSRFDFTPIEKIYQAAVFRLIDRGKHTQRFDVFEDKHVQHLRDNDKTPSDYTPKDLSAIADHENTIAYITCLFLERKYAFPFLSRLAGFQNTSGRQPTLAMRATMECYTMFCCRLPQPKLESSDILLDMVNELGRCPSALYTVLSEEDKERFHVKREVSPYLEYDEDDFEERLEQEIVLQRHGDRFPYFALRYFDDVEAFPTLRFDIHLGKWRTKPVYEKAIYNETRERLLTKSMHTFVKLGDILPLYEAVVYENFVYREDGEEKERTRKRVERQFINLFRSDWVSEEDDGTFYLDDRIERFSPKYNFGDHVIGLKFIKGPDRAVRDFLPKLPDPRNAKADAIISTRELRSLFLYDFLSKKPVSEGSTKTYIQTDTETFIKDYIDRINQFFSDVKSGAFVPLTAPPDYRKNEPLPYVKNNPEKTKKKRAEYRRRQDEIAERKQELNGILHQRYGLSVNQIPSRLREYLLAYKTPSFRVRARKKLQNQQEVVKKLLKDIEKGRSPRVGEQATWLAEDIIFLTPPRIHYVDGRPHPQKLNNDQFRVLQSSLAYFSVNKKKLRSFLQEETSILSQDKKEGHPFLAQIELETCSGILDFYATYLKAKAKWLAKILRKLKSMGDQTAEETYRHFLPASVKEKKAKKLDYTNLPVYLPRGLFDKAIKDALIASSKIGVQPEDSVTLCLARLMKEDTQDFYELPHLYQSIFKSENGENKLVEGSEHFKNVKSKRDEVKNKLKSKKLGKSKKQSFKYEYRDLTREKKRFLDREQYIRSIQADDWALWLMVQGRQSQKSEHLEIHFDQLKLRNIESILGEPIRTSLSIPGSSIRISDELPLRRYGDLRRVAKDRRLKNLALYYEAGGINKIAHDLVKKELERYDRRREVFFETIYHFEKTVFQKFEPEFFPAGTPREIDFFKHRKYVDVAVANSPDIRFNLFFQKEVANLRNKFHHNEFPWFEWFYPKVKARDAELFADRIFDVTEGYYNKMLQLI